MSLGCEQIEPELLHPGLHRVTRRLMASTHLVEALVEDGPEAGVERHDHRDRCGVVVGPGAAAGDVLGDHVEVEVPGLGHGDQSFHRSIRHGQRRQPRGHAETLLGAAVRNVDAPVVDSQLHATERCDAVGEQQRIAFLGSHRRRCRSRRRWTSRRAPSRTSPARDVRRASVGRRRADPTRARRRSPSAPVRPTTSTMRPPNTPFTPTTTVSPGPTKLTMAASIPADPVPDTGKVSAFDVANTVRSRSLVSSSNPMNSGSRCPSIGRPERGRPPRGTGCTGRDP